MSPISLALSSLLLLSCRWDLVAGVERAVCDDGEYKVEKDLGGEENWKCNEERFLTSDYYLPAGLGHCEDSIKHDLQPVCMQHGLNYTTHPPTQGDYRVMPPHHGEYRYLPPQRWLHTLNRGGVAFLYHPCTSSEQVDQLKALAQDCLNSYVVTPYPDLSRDQPLAVVTLGCVFKMSWVNPPEVKAWLSSRNIKPDSDLDQVSKYYHRDLQRPALVQPWDSLCHHTITTESPVAGDGPSIDVPHDSDQNKGLPEQSSTIKHHSNTTTTSKPCAPEADHCVVHSLNKTLKQHRTGLVVLIALVCVVLLGFVLLLFSKLVSSWRRRHPKVQRYKTVSKYFPFSYEKKSTAVVIPEVGMPKSGAAERQVLLDASDEDEL